ncbi:MAG TPA: hydantoinase B/oxoprolinase family protein, partial [Myxococcota bacterium]|nr:hydantoinase B/oxoprolinase family protein [Myxococcota bacterium]
TRQARRGAARLGTARDPVQLEVFNNLFMAVAEHMGAVLAQTATSVNIKERLDFSCAIFDARGGLVANAPHVPVHLGSMSDSVAAVIARFGDTLGPANAYVLNAPYRGGTHLPDVTVVTPVFAPGGDAAVFFVACRGHHADVGGITPGSMPPSSQRIDEEGVLLDCLQLVESGSLREEAMRACLSAGPHPARNIPQNIADLRAQLAANTTGVRELLALVERHGLEVVQAYMGHVQDNAEEAVREVIGILSDGAFCCTMDDGSVIAVQVRVDRQRRAACIDFTGTSGTRPNNFNAPRSITTAVVMYVFRCLVDAPLPLNAGCLVPLSIHIPPGCMLDPRYPAAVVAGNVETSQCIADALFGALGVLAGSQGTMNNLTFGTAAYQYYETLCGGAGAGPTFPGASAVHTHMTNSRLTDPEVLERRYPVRLERFAIRHGSGGAGRFPGGAGVVRELRFGAPMTVAWLTNRRTVAP